MAGTVKIRLFLPNTERNALGEAGAPILWREVWAEPTESGGSRRTYAGRLSSEYTLVLTTYWREGIEKCTHVEHEGRMRPINAIIREGFRRKVHIALTDGAYE
jgi:hypothetical protein